MELFSKNELRFRTGRSDLTKEEYEIVHAEVLDMLTGEVGEDVITDPPQPGVASIALEAARLLALNPAMRASKTIGPLSETYAQGAYAERPGLSHKQRIRLRKLCGLWVNHSVHTGVTSW